MRDNCIPGMNCAREETIFVSIWCEWYFAETLNKKGLRLGGGFKIRGCLIINDFMDL